MSLLLAMPVRAQETRLVASDAAVGDAFGAAVALSGDYAIVGARLEGTAADNFGAAYVFVREGGVWTEQAKLTASDAENDDRFGIAVALSGAYAVVGAAGEDTGGANAGAAYVFVREGGVWTEQAKLTAADANADDRFGVAVAIDDDVILVGATGDDDVAVDAGAFYVFTREGETWTEQVKINASDAVNGDALGNALALDGDYAVVGAVGDNFPDGTSGSAYVFVREGGVWTEQAKLFASDGAPENFFGNAVAISGEHVLIGMSRDDDNGEDTGSAYVFVRAGNTWSRQAKLTQAVTAQGDEFGHAVALDGAYAVVSARGADGDAGAVYVFERNGSLWGANCVTTNTRTFCNESARLTASDAAADEFGASVALSGTTALVGAPAAGVQLMPTGAAYVLELVDTGTAVEQVSGDVPTTYRLDPTYPNPFNPSTTLSFSLPVAGRVVLEVYDAAGARVATLVDGRLAAGRYTAPWEAAGLASGVYLARMRAGGLVQTQKMILLK